ncbi:MAG: molybdopterin molybdotransferase MoeA, partial [Cyanobacteria bacterium J06639_1]
MLPVHTAASLILKNASPLGVEWVDLSQARDRVLAEAIPAPSDFPPAPTSSMDGYAVRREDLETLPHDLQIVETVPAGTVPQVPVKSGQATRLFTGSILPEGADTVVMQEVVDRLDKTTARVTEIGDRGQFVRPQGQFCRKGDRVLSRGQRLGGAETAVLAAVQRSRVAVYRRPRVAILSTGNELVRIDQSLVLGQIVDSNQHGLAALVAAAGGIPECKGILADTDGDSIEAGEARLKDAISEA